MTEQKYDMRFRTKMKDIVVDSHPKCCKKKKPPNVNHWNCKHKWKNIRFITDAYAKEKGLEKENERFQVCHKCNSIRDNPKFDDKLSNHKVNESLMNKQDTKTLGRLIFVSIILSWLVGFVVGFLAGVTNG